MRRRMRRTRAGFLEVPTVNVSIGAFASLAAVGAERDDFVRLAVTAGLVVLVCMTPRGNRHLLEQRLRKLLAPLAEHRQTLLGRRIASAGAVEGLERIADRADLRLG